MTVVRLMMGSLWRMEPPGSWMAKLSSAVVEKLSLKLKSLKVILKTPVSDLGNVHSIIAGSFFRVVNEHGAIFNVSATYTNSVCDDQAEIQNKTFGEFAEFPDDEYCGPYVTVNASSMVRSFKFHCSTMTMYKFPNLYIKPTYEYSESGLFPGCYFDTKSSRLCPEIGVSCIDDNKFNRKITTPSLYNCSKDNKLQRIVGI